MFRERKWSTHSPTPQPPCISLLIPARGDPCQQRRGIIFQCDPSVPFLLLPSSVSNNFWPFRPHSRRRIVPQPAPTGAASRNPPRRVEVPDPLTRNREVHDDPSPFQTHSGPPPTTFSHESDPLPPLFVPSSPVLPSTAPSLNIGVPFAWNLLDFGLKLPLDPVTIPLYRIVDISRTLFVIHTPHKANICKSALPPRFLQPAVALETKLNNLAPTPYSSRTTNFQLLLYEFPKKRPQGKLQVRSISPKPFESRGGRLLPPTSPPRWYNWFDAYGMPKFPARNQREK